MADLFASLPDPPPPALAGAAPIGTRDLTDPRAHRCFRCGVVTPLGKGLPHRGEPIVWACKDHIGELG